VPAAGAAAEHPTTETKVQELSDVFCRMVLCQTPSTTHTLQTAMLVVAIVLSFRQVLSQHRDLYTMLLRDGVVWCACYTTAGMAARRRMHASAPAAGLSIKLRL
jgi:hypothetical protein